MPDKYSNITADLPLNMQAGYSPSESDQRLVQKLDGMFNEAQTARGNRVSRWRRNEELYNGDFLKPLKLPKYKSRIVVNFIHSNLESIYSILTDRKPVVDIMPKSEEQIDSAMRNQEMVECEISARKGYRAIRGMERDGLQYGNGYIKVTIDPDDGRALYSVPDVYTVYPDSLATCVEDLQYIVFAVPTYISSIRKEFPDKGKHVRSEGKLDAYRSFIHSPKTDEKDTQVADAPDADGNFTNADGTAGEQRVDYLSPVSESGIDGDFADGQVLRKECWYWQGEELRIATWAGNVLLEDNTAPMQVIPLVMVKNYGSVHSWWGKGEPEIVESLAVGVALLFSQGMDNMIATGNPQRVFPKTMLQNPQNRPSNKPGKHYESNHPGEKIQELAAGGLSGSTLSFASAMMQAQDVASGVHEVTSGRNPTGVTSGTAIRQLQEASQQIIRAKERDIGDDTMVSLYKLTLEIVKNNYVSDVPVRRKKGVSYEFSNVKPQEVDTDMEFKYVRGSAMPDSRIGRLENAIALRNNAGMLQDDLDFWHYTQYDNTKQMIDALEDQRARESDQKAKDMEIISESTDPQEIADAKLRLMGTPPPAQPQPQ